MGERTATEVDADTQRRIEEHAAQLVADWPPLDDRQREVVRNAFRRTAEQDSAA